MLISNIEMASFINLKKLLIHSCFLHTNSNEKDTLKKVKDYMSIFFPKINLDINEKLITDTEKILRENTIICSHFVKDYREEDLLKMNIVPHVEIFLKSFYEKSMLLKKSFYEITIESSKQNLDITSVMFLEIHDKDTSIYKNFICTDLNKKIFPKILVKKKEEKLIKHSIKLNEIEQNIVKSILSYDENVQTIYLLVKNFDKIYNDTFKIFSYKDGEVVDVHTGKMAIMHSSIIFIYTKIFNILY